MNDLNSWLLIISLAVITFLLRFSFIGLFSKKNVPPLIKEFLPLFISALFGAIASFSMTGFLNGPGISNHWVSIASISVALLVAISTRGNLFFTLISGMTALHLLPLAYDFFVQSL